MAHVGPRPLGKKKGKKEGNLERELGKDSKQLLCPYLKSAQRHQVVHSIVLPASKKDWMIRCSARKTRQLSGFSDSQNEAKLAGNIRWFVRDCEEKVKQECWGLPSLFCVCVGGWSPLNCPTWNLSLNCSRQCLFPFFFQVTGISTTCSRRQFRSSYFVLCNMSSFITFCNK